MKRYAVVCIYNSRREPQAISLIDERRGRQMPESCEVLDRFASLEEGVAAAKRLELVYFASAQTLKELS